MRVTADSKWEATRDSLAGGVAVRIFQGAAREHCLLSAIKSDGTELFPVAHELVFHDDFVDRKFTLEK